MANEDLLLRQMPHSLEGEQAVLGSMLIDEGCVKDVMDKLVPSDFYLRQNREIFETIYTMFTYARPIDGITVCEEMQKAGTYDENTTRSYLAQLMEITPTSANVMEYVAIVRDKALLRGVAQAAGEITVLVQEGIGEAAAILEAAEQKIYAVRRGQSAQDMVPLRMVLPDVLDRLNEMSESESRLPGLSTGLSAVDRKISGLNKSDLILLAARPGMGKTSFALNVALNVAKSEKKTVAMFSLEMSREQLATRLLSSEACVENTRLVTGSLRETDWEKIAAAAGVLNRVDIRIDDNPMLSVADMNAKCRRIDSLGLVVIDYLQLMTSASGGRSGENRQQVVSEMSRMLKVMAKELNVPVICLSQLSRASEKRDDKRPMLSDLRESGAIEQDADIVLFLYRDDYYLRTIDATGTSKDLSEYMGREGNYYYEIRAVGKTTNDAKYRKSSEYIVSSDRYLDDLGDTEGRWKNYADGKKYVDENGQIVTSQWYRILGTWYYFDENGYMVTGWRMVNNKWYYLGNDGKMVIGWKQVGGVWYYMDADGAMATGWRQTAPGQWYYLNANGAMAASTVIDGYTLDASGLWVS